jgi:HSP20 family protein
MNPLTRWNQLRWNQLNELEDLQHTLGSLFSRSRVRSPEDRVRVTQFIPLVDVSEDARGYLIRVELPRVKKEDVEIILENGTLTITGERKFDQNRKKDHPMPLAHGRFVNSFAVPNNARPVRATAAFNNGVLTVHLARNEKARPRQPGGKPASGMKMRSSKGLCSSGARGRKTQITRTNWQ